MTWCPNPEIATLPQLSSVSRPDWNRIPLDFIVNWAPSRCARVHGACVFCPVLYACAASEQQSAGRARPSLRVTTVYVFVYVYVYVYVSVYVFMYVLNCTCMLFCTCGACVAPVSLAGAGGGLSPYATPAADTSVASTLDVLG